MKDYLISSNYYDYETDMVNGRYTAVSAWDALVQDCAHWCGIPRHEAIAYLENNAYSVTIWELGVEDGVAITKQLRYQDVDYPWRAIQEGKTEIKQIEQALETAASLEFLLALPVMGDQQVTIDLAPARQYLQVRRTEVSRMEVDFNASKTPPGDGKELRSIQVDND